MAVGTGIGLRCKNVMVLYMRYFSIVIANAQAISDWFRPSETRLLYRIIANAAFVGLIVVIAGYFYKRQKEFV